MNSMIKTSHGWVVVRHSPGGSPHAERLRTVAICTSPDAALAAKRLLDLPEIDDLAVRTAHLEGFDLLIRMGETVDVESRPKGRAAKRRNCVPVSQLEERARKKRLQSFEQPETK